MNSDHKNRKRVFRRPVSRPDLISSYFRRDWKTLLIVTVSGTLFNAGQSLVAIRQGQLVDAIAAKEGTVSDSAFGANVLRAASVFLLTVLCVQLLRLAKRYYVRRFANRTDITMRMMVFNHIIHEDRETLEGENSGDIMTKALGDVDRTVEGMRKVTTEVFDTGVLLVTYYLTMLRFSVRCTVLSCLPVPVALAASHFLRAFVEKYNRKAREQSALCAQKSLDAVRNGMLYRVTGTEGRLRDDYEREITVLEKAETGAGILENSMQPVYNAISLCGCLAAIFYGGRLTLSGAWTVGDFTAYLTIYLASALKIAKVSKLFNTCQKAKVSFKRVKPYLTGWTPDPEEEVGEKDGWRAKGGHRNLEDNLTGGGQKRMEDSGKETGPAWIKENMPEGPAVKKASEETSLSHEELTALGALPLEKKDSAKQSGSFSSRTPIALFVRDVTVSPDGKKTITSPVSFAGKRGQIIGITGPVGSGKSLLGMALAGIGPFRGTIRMMGHETGILSERDRAGYITYMGHDPQLFSLSLADNILLGRERDEKRLQEVLSDVCLDVDIRSMPDGEDTFIGSGGRALSGGQRARVSCARTLYGRTPVIILDDPFANVDKGTEEQMIRNLKENYQDSLLVIISHRMKVFETADLVLMIEENGFVRIGTHRSLMKESRRYRETFEAQEGGTDHE